MDNSQNPILAPERELPAPHDMLLGFFEKPQGLPPPHITHKHPWLHWIPAIFGLFIGLGVGWMFITGANTKQLETMYDAPQVRPTQVVQKTTPQTYKSDIFSFTFPRTWLYQSQTESLMRSAPKNTPVFVLFNPQSEPVVTQAYTTLGQRLPAKEFVAVASFEAAGKSPEDVVDSIEKEERANQAFGPGFMRRKQTIGNYEVSMYTTSKKEVYAWYALVSNGIDMIEFGFSHDPLTHDVFKMLLASLQFTKPTVTLLPTLQLPDQPVACTMDVFICPDGSSVARMGPNCEFAPCTTQQP